MSNSADDQEAVVDDYEYEVEDSEDEEELQ